MDKIRQQKLEYFLLDLDGKIKEIRDYVLMDKGALLLDAIARFEEENAEFLQYNPSGQDELNKRKWIIQYTIFPIIDDNKVEELLQYHLLEGVQAGLDMEELMKMRAITISELLWPKISQSYLKALMGNTQLIGSNPISLAGEKTSFLPYIKNWISLYNRKFGIDKHTGLEPHQFILEDPNTQQLNKDLKEALLKVLKFYESMKVYSLSEIEAELRKMQLGFAAQQAAAYAVSKEQARGRNMVPDKTGKPTPIPSMPVTKEKASAVQKEVLGNKQIKIMSAEPQAESRKYVEPEKHTSEKAETTREIENGHIQELLEKYPTLSNYKITNNSISLPIAPFSLTPTVQNWIQYYAKECGKGKHSPQDRESFLDLLVAKQNINDADLNKLSIIFRSADEKIPVPFDKKNNELLLNQVKVGEKLKTTTSVKEKIPELTTKSPQPVIRMGATGISPTVIATKKDEGYMDLELVPANPAINKNNENK